MSEQDLELTREPIPTNTRAQTGKWITVLEAARDAATRGECVVFKADVAQYGTASATLHGHRQLRPNEKLHMSYDRHAGVVRVWLAPRSQP